ncbi:ABC transporter permease [Bifidobacterium xylocopae]|uniref:ABC transporter permease n=1 Tax=Bifidobacterium xylocopae TaxID=2493119 RepID=A0A366KDM3_9BIFI|nr:ABC transporter permease [Bifidobacterium xylocopae]RBP99810.1 ABC transporter permease [Bifidobacterium xylocopae]
MSEILTIARLRWALTFATVKRSSWQLVGATIAVILALQAVAGSWFLAVTEGEGLDRTSAADVRVTMVCALAALSVTVIMFQLMVIGEGSTLSPRRFVLFGIPDRRLQAGLMVAGLVGLPAICALICFLALAFLCRGLGPVVVIVSILAAPVAVLTMMSLSKAVLSLATSLASSQRAQNALYLVVFILFMLICSLPQTISPAADAGTLSVAQVRPFADILAFTPLAAAFQLPFDAANGDWAFLLLRLLILALTCWFCFAISTWCLRHLRLSEGRTGARNKAHGLGVFTRMPDSPSGAISARLVIYLRRDPRQLLYFLLPVIFLVVFGIQGRGLPGLAWQGVFLGALFLCMYTANNLAYDGPGIRMQVMAGLPGKADRKGRVRVYLWIMSTYMIVECFVAAFISDYWWGGRHLAYALVIACVVEGVLMAGIGLAQVLSCLLIYPVAPIDKPFSSPQGRAMAQGFFPFVQLLGNILVVLPTIIAFFALDGTGAGGRPEWLLAPIALVNGLAVLALGVNWGGRILDRRQLAIVAILDRYASL